jgi:mono/diheme cytochrome c family protein
MTTGVFTGIAHIRLRRFVLGAMIVVAAVAGAAWTATWKPAFAPIEPPVRAVFADGDISRGAELAALGDCAVCHTAPYGRTFAGGRGVQTPFGTVYATNITPDPATGIGRWPLEAFRRAMRDGIDREGRNLYPVLPYPHFIHATDDDIAAMYAFLMTRRPVRQVAPRNALTFPFSARPLLAGWNLLFLKPGAWQADPAKSPEWNKGAYLVEAIGHCGACHTPRNSLGAEQADRTLAGGEAEGWYAPALRAGSPSPKIWSVDGLATYLRTGLESGHGAAAGPMTAVTQQLATIPDADVRAMAVYVASLMPSATVGGTAGPILHPVADSPAAAVFAGACGVCHASDAPMTRGGAPSLALSTAVHAPTARDVVNVILHGLPWREGHAGPYMPAFADALTDAQVALLTAYLRARYSDLPAWPDVAATIREAKRQGGGGGS